MYKEVWKHLIKVSKPFHIHVIATLLLISTATLIGLLKPIFLEKLVDGAIVGNPINNFLIIIGIIIIVEMIFQRLFDLFLIYSQRKIYRNMYNYAFDHLMHHSYTFFTNTFGGSLVAKVKRFAGSFIRLQDNFVFHVYNTFFKIIVITIILFFKNALLAIVYLIWAIIYTLTSYYLTKKQQKYNEKEAEEQSKVTAKLADILTNVLTVKMFSTFKKEQKTYYKSTSDYEKSVGKSWNYSLKVWAAQAALLGVLEIVALVLSFKALEAGTITMGTVVLIQAYVLGTFGTVWTLGRGIRSISKSLSEMKEMVDIIDEPIGVADIEKPLIAKTKNGEIKFKNVSFKYHKKYVLKNFNLHIKSGEKIGLVGASGSGKSTLTKLLLRFVDINKGEITIDGQNIKQLKQDDLRNAISYVPQEPLLFHRTLKENISYAKKSKQKEIIIAAKKARAHQFIEEFPEKYNTLVGERGIKLSGGERQRVAIARAILKDSPILVMDEATSSLDTISENKIRDATEKLMKNKTSIIIAHRLSTVKKMDRIIVLSKGKIIEEGTHKQLLKNKRTYYNLYKHQSM